MADRPESDAGSGPAGRGDLDSPSDDTVRLVRPTTRESHSDGDRFPGGPAGQPSVQQDANIQDVSASAPRGPDPSTSSTIPGRAMDAPPIVSQTGLPAQSSSAQSVDSAAGLHQPPPTSDGAQVEPPSRETTPARGMLPRPRSVRLRGSGQGPPTLTQQWDTDLSARYASARPCVFWAVPTVVCVRLFFPPRGAAPPVRGQLWHCIFSDGGASSVHAQVS